MHRSFAYRSYWIWRDGKDYVAAPLDDEANFEIASHSLDNLTSLIDQTWEALEQESDQHPPWIRRLHEESGRIYPDRPKTIARRLAPLAVMVAIVPALGFALDADQDGRLSRRELRPVIDMVFPLPRNNVVIEGVNGGFYRIHIIRHPTSDEVDFKLLAIDKLDRIKGPPP